MHRGHIAQSNYYYAHSNLRSLCARVCVFGWYEPVAIIRLVTWVFSRLMRTLRLFHLSTVASRYCCSFLLVVVITYRYICSYPPPPFPSPFRFFFYLSTIFQVHQCAKHKICTHWLVICVFSVKLSQNTHNNKNWKRNGSDGKARGVCNSL